MLFYGEGIIEWMCVGGELTEIREKAGSYQVARSTAEFYRNVISSGHWETPESAISSIHKLGNILTKAQPIGSISPFLSRVLIFL